MAKQTEQNVAISRRRIVGEAQMVVNEIFDGCLYTGFFGTLDSARLKKVIDRILVDMNKSANDLLIVDLANVDVIDSAIASQLNKMVKTLELVGIDTLLCGINPSVAQSIVNAQVDMSDFSIFKNLKIALREAYKKKGLEIRPIVTF